MAIIELFVKTTVDFDLFEAFAKFIADEEPKKNGHAPDYHETLKNILMLEIGAGTLQNKLAKARNHTFVFELEKESYEAFCNKFTAAFKKMSPERQREYRAIEISFDQWKSRLDSNNIKGEKASQHVEEISSEESEETISTTENNNVQKSSDDGHPVTHKQFVEARDLILKYYTWDRPDELPHEIILANMFEYFVRQRETPNYDIKHIRSIKDTYKRIFTYADWEIYELYGGRVVRRSLQFSQLPDGENESFPGFKSYTTIGREGTDFGTVSSGYGHDYFEYDDLHETILISNCNFERRDRSLDLHFKENYSFHYQHNKYGDIHAGHKCSLDGNGILTCIPAFLVANIHSNSKQAPYHIEYNINSTDIPAIIRSSLLGWKYFKLFPFKNIYLTAHLTYRGEIFYPPFDEVGYV